MMSDYCVIMSTTGSQAEADQLAEALISERLAACVQIFPITSYYNWEGKMNKDAEWFLFIKTREDQYVNVEKFILENHSYDVPEIIQIPILRGQHSYLDWIDKNTIAEPK